MNAEEIVRLLAAVENPTVMDRDYAPASECGLCGAMDAEYKHVLADPIQHEPTCPWRLAREWAETREG